MPYKTWSLGEEMVSAEFTTYIGNQVVATFADATQRTAQLPGPTKGQLTTLDNRPGVVQIWSGSAWLDVTPQIATGVAIVTTNGAGGGVISYANPFATPPVTHMIDVASSGDFVNFGIVTGQALNDRVGFVARAASTGDPFANAVAAVGYTAFGARP